MDVAPRESSSRAPEPVDAVVLGAGAAGLFCAATAARRGRSVLLLEGNPRPGMKILVSGGGRANFTNRAVGPEHYVSSNEHFARSALARFPPERFIARVEAAGIPYHERDHGQLFCNESARRIADMLLADCASGGVDLRTGCRVRAEDVSRIGDPDGAPDATHADDVPAARNASRARDGARFRLRTPFGVVRAASLVVATGGLSWPRLGTSDVGYALARRFGLPVHGLRPGLVPLQWSAEDRARFGDLAGIAVPARVTLGARDRRRGGRSAAVTFREAVLFTHGGLSGPAILQISNHWLPGHALRLDWLPDVDLLREWTERKAAGDTRSARRAVSEVLPRRLVDALLGDLPAAARPLAQVSRTDLAQLAARVNAMEWTPAGDAGWEKAEVTVGGVDTAALSSRTLEAEDVPGLYFIGEVVDVTGWLGGFNFQWAWASAHAAAEAL